MPARADVALSLTLAVIGSSTSPLVLLDGDLTVIAISASFCQAFAIDPIGVAGQKIFALGAGEWDVPQFRALLGATASGEAEVETYEMELRRPGQPTRTLAINVQKLIYGDRDHPRLLLAASDLTDGRARDKLKEDLMREKAILLQEVQHRVANSLQIIASVILQTARKSQSEEARGHLQATHHRVMSVAALQQQLAASSTGDVGLRAYFGRLCESIGASLIHNHEQLVLEVEADDSVVPADISVSLGLVVTELVINALKHAFPAGRPGRIVVAYATRGADWVLSVSDDGVGMPKAPAEAKAGLGTNIVQALAKQLHADIQTLDTRPGTRVCLVHGQAAAPHLDARPADLAV